MKCSGMGHLEEDPAAVAGLGKTLAPVGWAWKQRHWPGSSGTRSGLGTVMGQLLATQPFLCQRGPRRLGFPLAPGCVQDHHRSHPPSLPAQHFSSLTLWVAKARQLSAAFVCSLCAQAGRGLDLRGSTEGSWCGEPVISPRRLLVTSSSFRFKWPEYVPIRWSHQHFLTQGQVSRERTRESGTFLRQRLPCGMQSWPHVIYQKHSCPSPLVLV